jgi:hypothetical protein
LLERADGLLPAASVLEHRLRRTLARDALQRAGRAYDKGRTEIEPVEDMVAFAIEVFDGDVKRLPEWHTLRLRRALGPRRAAALRPLSLAAGGRAVRRRWRRRRWELSGI